MSKIVLIKPKDFLNIYLVKKDLEFWENREEVPAIEQHVWKLNKRYVVDVTDLCLTKEHKVYFIQLGTNAWLMIVAKHESQ